MRLGHISGRQFMFMLAFLMGTKVLYMFPTVMARKSGSSAWISILIAAVLGLGGVWGWIRWVDLTGSTGFVWSLRKTCGRLLGDFVALATLVGLVAVTGWTVRLFAGGAVVGILPEFPIEALVWTSVIAGLYGAWLGLEAVGRAAGFFFWPTLISFVLVMASLWGEFEPHYITPLWGLGVGNTILQGFLSSGAFGGIVAIGIMKPYVRKRQELSGKSVRGLLIAAAVLVIGLVFVAGVFPYPMSIDKADPLGAIARAVYLGRFIQRVEALFIFVWLLSTSVQLSFLYVICLVLVSELSGTGTYRPFAPALAVLTSAIATLAPNTLRAAQLMDRYFTTSFGNAVVLLGWALYGVARARGMKPKSVPEGGDVPHGVPPAKEKQGYS
ncbi:MAG: GerAB/ArcD/ProY family transporter [Bacillota bacterium]